MKRESFQFKTRQWSLVESVLKTPDVVVECLSFDGVVFFVLYTYKA